MSPFINLCQNLKLGQSFDQKCIHTDLKTTKINTLEKANQMSVPILYVFVLNESGYIVQNTHNSLGKRSGKAVPQAHSDYFSNTSQHAKLSLLSNCLHVCKITLTENKESEAAGTGIRQSCQSRHMLKVQQLLHDRCMVPLRCAGYACAFWLCGAIALYHTICSSPDWIMGDIC